MPLPARGADVRTVRRLLAAAGFTAAGIRAAGIDLGLGARSADLPILRRALAPREPLATLVRLFVIGDPVAVDTAERAFGSLGPARAAVGALVDAGLVGRRDGQLEPRLRLTPWRGLLIAHDPDPSGELWPEHVTGPNPAAEALVDVVVPRPGARVLDLGTGSGLLALHLARDADAVVATDLNPAACRYAALGAELNETRNVEVRQGDLFEPVDGETFDLIVSNPPFVIAPDTDLLFRHASRARDEVSREVARGAAARLADAGIAEILCNWIVPRGEAAEAVPLAWARAAGCDALLLLNGVDDPLAYTVRWNGRAQVVDPDGYPELLDRWLRYYEREGITAVASGILVLRRRSGSTWSRSLALDAEPGPRAGLHVDAIIRGIDALEALRPSAPDADAPLAAARVRLLSPNRLDQSLLGREDEYTLEAATLTLDGGVGVRVAVDPELLPVLLRLDGTRPLRAAVEEARGDAALADASDSGGMLVRATALARRALETGLAEIVGSDARG